MKKATKAERVLAKIKWVDAQWDALTPEQQKAITLAKRRVNAPALAKFDKGEAARKKRETAKLRRQDAARKKGYCSRGGRRVRC